jgi:hypothetical protein
MLIAGGAIGRDQRHTYNVPLPISLRARAEWHRFTVTLACLAPASVHLNKYRAAKVFFDLDRADTGGDRTEADHLAVRRGACQHEIFEGDQALAFAAGGTLAIHVECMDHAQRLRASQSIRYALVASVETAVTTSATIFDEVRMALQAEIRTQTQESVRAR